MEAEELQEDEEGGREHHGSVVLGSCGSSVTLLLVLVVPPQVVLVVLKEMQVLARAQRRWVRSRSELDGDASGVRAAASGAFR